MGNLVIAKTSNFETENIYWDMGSGARMDGAFWRAIPPAGFYLLGDYAQENYNQPRATMVVVQDSGSGGTPAIAAPISFTLIWGDQGSGADEDGAIWMPVAPDGYRALGAVASRGYNHPSTDLFRCVRSDLVTEGLIGGLIWNDQGSGANNDVSIYAINPQGSAIAARTFYAQPNYNDPFGSVFCLLSM